MTYCRALLLLLLHAGDVIVIVVIFVQSRSSLLAKSKSVYCDNDIFVGPFIFA